MEIQNVSKKRLNSLSKLKLAKEVLNTEAELFLIDGKNNWDKKTLVFKKLYVNQGEIFSNKLYTINELINKKNIINTEELVMPEKVITVKGEVAGFTMPYIDNINLKTILKDDHYDVFYQLSLLKEVGSILERLKRVRNYTSVTDFYLNDIHEANFILNKQTGKINVVDLDSCKIGHNLAQASKYLSIAEPLLVKMNKYESDKQIETKVKYEQNYNTIGGSFVINQNTELFCYNMMILNYLYGDNVATLNLEEFCLYLEYLVDIGVPKELVDIFNLIYIEKDNINPYEMLDCLKEPVYQANHHLFDYKMKKKNKM